jgi:hypothetical protein
VNRIEKDPLQKRLEITNWIVLAVLVVLSAVFMPLKFTWGILFGGLICIINFHWLYRNLRNVFQQLADGAKSAIMIRYYPSFVLTAVILYLIISKQLADVICLLIGLSVVVINIAINVVLTLSKKNFVQEVR